MVFILAAWNSAQKSLNHSRRQSDLFLESERKIQIYNERKILNNACPVSHINFELSGIC
jgi:hypothetical protein